LIHEIADRIAEYIRRELNITSSRKAIIAFGLEAIIGGFIKLATFITLPLFLGILPQTWTALLASAFFRFPAGGAHCSAYKAMGRLDLFLLTITYLISGRNEVA